MPDDHPGFETWSTDDKAHPFPVGEILYGYATDGGASMYADFTLPAALPDDKSTMAERSIGVAKSCKISFALECTRTADGSIECEGVVRGTHLGWFEQHKEDGAGPRQEIRITAAQLAGAGGHQEVLAKHPPNHSDMLEVSWTPNGGKITCHAALLHMGLPPDELKKVLNKNYKDAERLPPSRHAAPAPTPAPSPAPDPPPKPPDGP